MGASDLPMASCASERSFPAGIRICAQSWRVATIAFKLPKDCWVEEDGSDAVEHTVVRPIKAILKHKPQ